MGSLEKWLQGLPGRGTHSDPEGSESTTVGLCPPVCDSKIGYLLGAGADFSQEEREGQGEDILGKVWVHVLFCVQWAALAEWLALSYACLNVSREGTWLGPFMCLSLFLQL